MFCRKVNDNLEKTGSPILICKIEIYQYKVLHNDASEVNFDDLKNNPFI